MKDTVTKAQGFEDAPEPVETFEEKKPKPAPRKLTKEELEHQEQEKMKLFSEFVAADAEANTPKEKKEDPMEKPLHFKYYQDENDTNLMESTTDAILGEASH